MEENSQEGYKTLGWIIEKSEQGLFLVVADEMMQKEIVDIYRKGTVKIYDYKRHPGGYSFYDLQKSEKGTADSAGRERRVTGQPVWKNAGRVSSPGKPQRKKNVSHQSCVLRTKNGDKEGGTKNFE